MISVIDVGILLFLLLGGIVGFKKGFIRSAVGFVGTLIVFVLAYFLKNPLSKLMYTNLPFFKFNGILEGVSVLNIIIYEVIAYLIVILILWAVLRIVVSISGVLEKILNWTIVLGIPSKILGFIFGLCETFLIIFVILFSINQLAVANNQYIPGKFTKPILNSTPILSNQVSKAYGSVTEIIDKAKDFKDSNDKDAFNREALDILLKNKIVSVDSVETLIKKDKLEIKDSEELLDKYRGGKND